MRKLTTLIVNAAIRLHRKAIGREIAAAHNAEVKAWDNADAQRLVVAAEQRHHADLLAAADDASRHANTITEKALAELESLPHRV